MSSVEKVEVADIETAGWHVRDAKFVDDQDLVLAVSDNSKDPQFTPFIASSTDPLLQLHLGYFGFRTAVHPPFRRTYIMSSL